MPFDKAGKRQTDDPCPISRGTDAKQRERLAEKMKDARKKLKLSQNDAARLVGVTQSMLSRWERNGEVAFVVLERLAYLYGMKVTDFATERIWEPYEPHTLDDYRVRLKTGKFPRR